MHPLNFTFTKDWLPIDGELYWTAPSSNIILQGHSPAEFRIYDSQGRVTGLVDGVPKEEIPNSFCAGDTIFIFDASDYYHYEVVGTGEGAYGLDIFSVTGEKVDTFSFTDISIAAKVVHQYTTDSGIFAQGGHTATVQIDSNGDGIFEETRTLQPPIASFTLSPNDVSVNEEISFDASLSRDVDGTIAAYQWDFGDGNNSTGEMATHTFLVPGEYMVSLAVVDNDGVVSSHSRTIQVGERQGMPTWGWAIIAIGILVIAVIVLRRRRAAKV